MKNKIWRVGATIIAIICLIGTLGGCENEKLIDVSTATPTVAVTELQPNNALPTQMPEASISATEQNVLPSTMDTAVASVSEEEEASDELEVHYIDVGQADSIFIELPNGEDMLIDAGNNDDGDDVVRYISNLGYSSIDYIVGTHPHEDHIGGMDNVVNSFNIKNIYMPKASSNTQTFEDLLLAIKNKGIAVSTAKAGVSILDSPDLKITLLAPNSSQYKDLNNYSVVLKLIYRNTSFLFMGDAEEISENEIMDDVDVDVLKAGHHGSSSSTSTTFLHRVSPIYAIISAGEGNTYGHPAQGTLEKLNAAGVEIYRTDLNGTITISTDGDGYDIKTKKTASASEPKATATNTPSSTLTQPIMQSDNTTVYVTKSGKKYHVDGCHYLKSSKIAISLSDAKAKGYEPCSACNPPT